MDWKKCPLTDRYYEIVKKVFGSWLNSQKITPGQLTFSGFVLALLVPLGFYVHAFWGVVLIGLSGLADTLDGLVAREQNKVSTKGAFWDSSLDRISDLFYLLGFYVLSTQSVWYKEAGVMLFLAVGFSFLISYLKARAQSLGKVCESGLMDRVSRTVFLLVWGLLLALFGFREGLFFIGLVVYVFLTLFTVIQRFIEVNKQF